jgi:hypothetical protein
VHVRKQWMQQLTRVHTFTRAQRGSEHQECRQYRDQQARQRAYEHERARQP